MFYHIKKIVRILKRILRVYIFNKKIKYGNEKKCFVMLAADYGNIGDLAITYAQNKFIKNNLKDYKIINISISEIFPCAISIRKSLSTSDIITVIGGGNTGNVYYDFEEKRRFICSFFKKNKIILFPQTIDFTNDNFGLLELSKSKRIYLSNKNLNFFLREKMSFDFFKKNKIHTNFNLVPDIVFSLTYNKNNVRNGITLCLRDDIEKNDNINFNINLINKFVDKYGDIDFVDTYNKNINPCFDETKKYVDIILDKFSKSNVVITDRLHGMIFCYITNTPCIVFDNSNHKIKSTYDTWLSRSSKIFFADDERLNYELVLSKITDKNNSNNLDLSNEFSLLLKIFNEYK